MMPNRPLYVGVGECTCGRIDTKLFHLPNTNINKVAPICAACLVQNGHKVPTPRTAADVDMIDGKPAWRTQPATQEPPVHSNGMPLGHGHVFEAVMGSDDKLVGWLNTHPDARGRNEPCQNFVAVRPLNGAPVYQILSADPLTLVPSVKCPMCGAHGNVTNGKWEPC